MSEPIVTTPGFLEWSRRKGETHVLGTEVVVSNKLLKHIDEHLKTVILQQMARAVALKMVDESLLALSVAITEQTDPDTEAVEIIALVNTYLEPFLLPYTFKLERRLEELSSMSWWKLAWLKMRGGLRKETLG